MATMKVSHGRTETIRALNDRLRTTLTGGVVHLTAGVRRLGETFQTELLGALSVYDDFDQDNDPYGEHDFGLLVVNGHEVIFKIDYFDKDLTYHSPNPADESATERVITLLLPEEY